MDIIIYGAGKTAMIASDFIGYSRINYFAVTYKNRTDDKLLEKEIISYETMLDFYNKSKNCYIVIASDQYYLEMEANLKRDGIKNYIVFHSKDRSKINEYLPIAEYHGKFVPKSYSEILYYHNLSAFKKIAILGTNPYLKYFIIALKYTCPFSKIVIVDDGPRDETFLDIEYISFDNIEEVDCIILNFRHNDNNFRNENNIDTQKIKIIDLFDTTMFNKYNNYSSINQYHNIHKGKRCFIVATGPSLNFDDLEMLNKHNEICLSVNKIYRCYTKTKWRANYVGVTDPKILADVLIDKQNGVEMPDKLFIGDNNIKCGNIKPIEDCEYFHLNCEDFEPNPPRFSEDMSICSYRGCTVTYDFALQMAAYMGFSEIYLLGVDHSMTGKISDVQNHFIENYYTEKEKDESHFTASNWDGASLAYQSAENYSRKHGFRIYNATRGGKLEVFERVNFDDLFSD